MPSGDATARSIYTRLTDGTTDATIRDLTNSNPLDVSIVDANGDQITSFGGGTEYTEGDTDASITGKAILWEDDSDTLRAVSADKPLPVDDLRRTGFNSYDEDTSVVSTVETIVLTYTVPAGKTANIEGFSGTGTATGRFKLKVAGTTNGVIRTSTSERSKNADYKNGPVQASAGAAVTVTAYHEEVSNQTMECSLYGYLT